MNEPGDIGQLSENIKIFIQDRNFLCRIAEYNYRYTRERFDITIIAKELSDIFNGCLNNNWQA